MLNSFEFIGEKIIDNTIEQTPVQIEIVSRVVSDIEGSKRSLAGATSAANCVVSGTGISGTLTAFTTYTVTVTAKDSSGVNVGHGGDKFRVEIYNKCTMGANSICNTVSGARQTLSATINAAMTDNGDGTYTYNFSVQLDGAVTIIVRLVNTGVVNCKWYSNPNFSGSPVKINTTSSVYFDANGQSSYFIPGQGENFSGIIYGSITPIASGVYTFTLIQDDGSQFIFNGGMYINRMYQLGSFSDSFSVFLTYGGYYDFTINYYQGPVLIKLILQWSSPYFGNQNVASSAFTTYDLIGSSPYQMTTVCPTGYTGNDPTSTTKCKEICGDGLKVGSEQCDDGNTINNDGCQSDCTLITPGFACTGGGSTSKDVCSQCLTGYTPNSDKSACVPICGDSLRMATESCDDGNTSNNDGCSSLCAIESGYTCSGGSTTSKDTCVKCSSGFYQDPSNLSSCIAHCADGLRAGSEVCDDANTSSGDGCSSTCSIESGYICNGGSTTSKDTCTKCSSGFYPNSSKTQCITSCGDGLKAGTEMCDDGNIINNDGCQSDCTLITPGFACVGGGSGSKDICTQCLTGYIQSSDKTACVPNCGDGLKMPSELCDDGNLSNGDGCSNTCNIESGYSCTGGSTTSKDTCVKCSAGLYQDLTNPSSCIPHCADGLRAGSEVCDDANTSSGDGCSSTCSIESGYICNGGSTTTKDTCTKCSNGFYPNSSKTQCITSCGDGLKAGTEMCDDGNTISNDGCESDCTIITAGFACTGGGSTSKDLCSQCLTGYTPNSDKSACVAICGDSLRMPTESCDDGNTSNNDGCSSLCNIESGYTCSGGSTTSKDTCVKCSAGFYQDPSNLSRCITHCGDGKRAGSEVCDDANTSDGDGCSSTCSSIETGYVCAGGSPTSQDTCTFCTSGFYQNGAKSLCVTICGDGLRAGAEKCDDNNSLSGDGCKNDCSSVEASYVCSGGSPTSKDTCTFCTSGLYQNDAAVPTVCVPHCGDGLKSGTEQCDDGNNIDNDGCQADCTLITPGYVCDGGGTTTKDACVKCSTGYIQNPTKDSCIPNCGDGFRYGTEKCDDGNVLNGDGCKSDCTIDSGWICNGGTNISKDVCTKCDKGFYQNDSLYPTSCIPKCGDGLRVSYEHCDDGNTISGDGCASNCMKIEDGWACFGGYFGVTDVCIQCDLGYDPNPDYSTCIGQLVPRDAKAMAAASQAAAYMGVSTNLMLTVFSSSTSSSSNSFGMLNQIQLVIILPLIGAYIPEKIYDYLKSMSTSLFNLNFLPTSNSGDTNSFKSMFDYKQPNTYLYLLELNSGSAFVNILDLSTTVCFVICAHILLTVSYAIIRRIGRFTLIKKIMLKIIDMLTFGFYIGVLLETSILFLLVDISEIHYQNKNGITNLRSTIMSYVIAAFILLFILLTLWQWCKSRTPEVFEKQKYFVFLVGGFKPSWICRSYWLIFLIRRTLFIAIIFFMEKYDMMIKISLFVAIQGLYFSYIIILRPQASVKENINDFVNEIFYLYFVVFLVYFNEENRWTNTTTEAYFWILMSNNFILIFIMLVSAIRIVVVTIRNFCNKRKIKAKISNENTRLEMNGQMQNQYDTNVTLQNKVVEEEQKESMSKFEFNNETNDGKLNNLSQKIKGTPPESTNRQLNNDKLIVEDI